MGYTVSETPSSTMGGLDIDPFVAIAHRSSRESRSTRHGRREGLLRLEDRFGTGRCLCFDFVNDASGERRSF